jgi:hypothetical protein
MSEPLSAYIVFPRNRDVSTPGAYGRHMAPSPWEGRMHTYYPSGIVRTIALREVVGCQVD